VGLISLKSLNLTKLYPNKNKNKNNKNNKVKSKHLELYELAGKKNHLWCWCWDTKMTTKMGAHPNLLREVMH
jgi:hypothetical protein